MSDDLKAIVQSQFGANPEGYATSDIHAKGESLGILLELVQPQADWHVLDVATGGPDTPPSALLLTWPRLSPPT